MNRPPAARRARRLAVSAMALGAVLAVAVSAWAAAGDPDSFNPQPSDRVISLAVQSDGRVIAGGWFTFVGNPLVGRNRIARWNTDGTLDTGFNPDANGYVNALTFDAAGKIIAGGFFGTIGGQTRGGLARLNGDGTADTAFANPALGGEVYAVRVLPSGQILAGGQFPARDFVRVNADGTRDNAYPIWASDPVRAIGVQSDGKVVIGGDFAAVSGNSGGTWVAAPGIARINANDTLDTGFAPTMTFSSQSRGYVYAIEVQSDGKFLVGGQFDTVNGQSLRNLVRFNADGTLDTAFSPNPNNVVTAITLQSNGQVVVGGNFTTIAGESRNRVARLNGDGTLDTSFTVPGNSSYVNATALQSDGKVLIGCNGTCASGRTYLARVAGVSAPGQPTGVTGTRGNGQVAVSWTAPASDGGSAITSYTASASPQVSGVTRTCTATAPATTCTVTGLTNGTAYTFTVTATSGGGGTGAASTASAAVTPATTPGQPTGVVGNAGNQKVEVRWTAPASTGGSAITGYVIEVDSGSGYAVATTTACSPVQVNCEVVTGLINGTAYTFRVSATNAVGTGSPSTASASVTPGPTAPGTPTGVVGTRGNAEATVTWTAPADDGGSAVTGYVVQVSSGGTYSNATTTACLTPAATCAVVTGLANGTTYTFKVKATNAIGTGNASSASSSVTPATVPGAPTGVYVSSTGDRQATVMIGFTPTGGLAITVYTVTADPGGQTCITAGGSSCTVTNLTNGTAYTFTATATNAVGMGPASSPTAAATPQGTADAPTGVSATAGDGQATVTWTAPVNTGGLVITRYTAVASPGGRQCSWNSVTGGPLQCTVTGLANGTAYTFEVRAINSAGPSSPSSPSSPVVPVAGSGGGSGGGSSSGGSSAGGSTSGGSSSGGSSSGGSGGGGEAAPTTQITVTAPVDGEAEVTVGWTATAATAATTLTTALPTGVDFGRSRSGCATARAKRVSVAVPRLRKGQRGSCSYTVRTERTRLVLTVKGGARATTTVQGARAQSDWVRAALRLLNRGTPRATLNTTLDAVRSGAIARGPARATIRTEVLDVREAQIADLPDLGPAPVGLEDAERLLRRSLVLSAKADRAYIAWLGGEPAELARGITFSILASSAKGSLITAMQGHGVEVPPATGTWP